VSQTFTLAGYGGVGVHKKQAARRTEQLRFSVIDGLAQAYKTPLTAILAASAGLSELGKLSPTQADLVALIDEQARTLSELTTRLLVTARLDAREAQIDVRPVGVEPIIDDTVAGLRTRLAGRKVVINLEDDSQALCCDRQLIMMLLTQYIDNACKYSTAGTPITIHVAYANSAVIFSVHNFGPVIPLVERDCIFDHYSLPSSLANRTGSAGFGLSVAKRIASVHGGYVWVTSDEAMGTTFFAAIPSTPQQRS
jgi:two-component system sensor histidine kinase KdpD